jgi:hypothetical protein
MEPQALVADAMTTRDLVRDLGGPSAIAQQLGVSAQAVTNWYRDGIPRRHHLPLWQMAQAKGLTWRPPGMEGVTLAPAPAADPAPLATPEAA